LPILLSGDRWWCAQNYFFEISQAYLVVSSWPVAFNFSSGEELPPARLA
jgi:hypothetical protein